jgi:hypothetical protein
VAENYPIAVIQAAPARQFEVGAFLDGRCESRHWATPSVEKDAIPELEPRARAAACDAIINIEMRSIHATAPGIVHQQPCSPN